MSKSVFRIHRYSDKYTYGSKVRFKGEDSCWHKEAGKTLSERAVRAILAGVTHLGKTPIQDVYVAEYRLEEVAQKAALGWVAP